MEDVSGLLVNEAKLRVEKAFGKLEEAIEKHVEKTEQMKDIHADITKQVDFYLEKIDQILAKKGGFTKNANS